MQFMEEAVHYTERSAGQLHKRLFHEGAFTLTYPQQTSRALLGLSQQGYSCGPK